jgi:hypothetical protein
MKWFRFGRRAATVVVLCLAACTPRVLSTVTVYHALPAYQGKSISVVPGNGGKNPDLEFRTFAARLEDDLQKAGFSVQPFVPNAKTDFVAVLSYGIDNGTVVTTTSSAPQYGKIGEKTPFPGSISKEDVYGVTGYSTSSDTSTIYKRSVSLDIYEGSKYDRTDVTQSNASAQVYQGKLSSQGPCGAVGATVPPMIDALFVNFPGDNGKTQTQITKAAEGTRC